MEDVHGQIGVTLYLVNIEYIEGVTSVTECSGIELSIGDDCLFRGKCHFLSHCSVWLKDCLFQADIATLSQNLSFLIRRRF